MKFIPKYQAGSIFTPYLHQIPVFPAQTGGKTAEAGAEAGGEGLLSKEIVKELMKVGLTNDVDSLIYQIQKIEAASANPYNNISTQRATLEIFKNISKVKRNYDLWKDALNVSKNTNKSLNDVAISSQGTVFTRDSKGYIKEISMGDYAKNKSKVRALTVNELLLERDNNPSLAFNNSLIDPIQNSIGLTKATEELSKLISKIKPIANSITTSHSKEDIQKQRTELRRRLGSGDLSDAQVNAVIESIQEIDQALNTPGEAFQHKKERTALEGQKYELALNTLLVSLNPAARQRLMFQVVDNDIKDSKGNYSLANLVGSHLSTQTEESNLTALTPISIPSSSKDKDFALNTFANLHLGIVRKQNTEFALNDAAESNSPGLGFLMSGVVAASNPIVTPQGNNFGMARLDTILNSGNYSQFLDTTKMYAGRIKITQPQQFIYDGGTALNVFLPTKGDGTVDHDSIDRFKELYNKFEANKEKLTPQNVKRLFAQGNFNVNIEGTGKDMKISATSPGAKNFLVMYAYTTEKAVDLNSKMAKQNKQYAASSYRKVDDDTFDAMSTHLAALWKDRHESGKSGLETNHHPGTAMLGGNNLLKTLIYIPYTPTASFTVQALSGGAPRQAIADTNTMNVHINATKVNPVSSSDL